MKTIKFLIFLIILGLAGLLVYQNIDYFSTSTMLTLNLKFTGWTVPELPNWAFWGICLGLGLLITGIKGLVTAFGLGREIKKRDARIAELAAQNSDLQARLDVFIHDPYIKKGLSETRQDIQNDALEKTREDVREDTLETADDQDPRGNTEKNSHEPPVKE
jgi:hypothetical protein